MSARGEFVAVYDAEDRPHKDQLKAAYIKLRSGGGRLACVQAPLVADNRKANWISSQWALEYQVQFGLILPAMAALAWPVLLGGTSNHFRKSALLAVGGWDATNVTEDADLGVRLVRAGLSTGMIEQPTYEDAPESYTIWLSQRSRWLKGFMQTWLVLSRSPLTAMRQMGPMNFFIAQVQLLGGILSPILHFPTLVLVLLSLISPLHLGWPGYGLLVLAMATGLIGEIAAPGKMSGRRLLAMLTRPLYWPLHSFAAYLALWELVRKPHFWAKTPHQPHSE